MAEGRNATMEISRGQGRLGGRRPRYCGRKRCVLKGRRKHREPGCRRPAGAAATRNLVSGGGADGLPPANFLGAFSASPNPLTRPINSTENSEEPLISSYPFETSGRSCGRETPHGAKPLPVLKF